MIIFLIQTLNGRVLHDFSFHLIEAIEYQNWFYNDKIYDYAFSESSNYKTDWIPVGSLEFVFDYVNQTQQIIKQKIKPINIPNELMKFEFLKRNVIIKPKEKIKINQPTFVKSHSFYKSFTEILENENPLQSLLDEEFLISECIEIESEWRVFVHNGKMVGIHHYTGDFTLFPDVSLINQMIKDYTTSPLSYTLDIGINQNGTFLIEIHPFVSCGLYGFRDYRILPQMFINGYRYLLQTTK